MLKETAEYYESFLAKYQYGFRKGFSDQQCHLSWRQTRLDITMHGF